MLNAKKKADMPERVTYALLLAAAVVSVLGSFFLLKSMDRMVYEAGSGKQQTSASIVDVSALKTAGMVSVEILPRPGMNETNKSMGEGNGIRGKGMSAVNGSNAGDNK